MLVVCSIEKIWLSISDEQDQKSLGRDSFGMEAEFCRSLALPAACPLAAAGPPSRTASRRHHFERHRRSDTGVVVGVQDT